MTRILIIIALLLAAAIVFAANANAALCDENTPADAYCSPAFEAVVVTPKPTPRHNPVATIHPAATGGIDTPLVGTPHQTLPPTDTAP